MAISTLSHALIPMEIFMHNVPLDIDEYDVKIALATHLHGHLFPNVKANFRVDLHHPKKFKNANTGTFTTTDLNIALRFLDLYGPKDSDNQIHIRQNRIFFQKSFKPPNPDLVDLLYRSPWVDPKIEREQNQRYNKLYNSTISLQSIQFGWMCRDGVFSIEHEARQQQQKCFISFDPMRQEIHITSFNDSSSFIIAIRQSSIIKISVYKIALKGVIFLQLEIPPMFLRRNSKGQTYRLKTFSTARNPTGTATIPNITRNISLVLSSHTTIDQFLELSKLANVCNIQSDIIKTAPRKLFSNLISLEQKIQSFEWKIAFQLSALLHNSILDPTELLKVIIPKVESTLETHGTTFTAELLKTFSTSVLGSSSSSSSGGSGDDINGSISSCFDSIKLELSEQGHTIPLNTTTTTNNPTNSNSDSNSDSDVCQTYHAMITPTSIFLNGPFLEKSNRVIRRYEIIHQESFLRVEFREEDGLHYRWDSDINNRAFIHDRFGFFMKEYVDVNGQGQGQGLGPGLVIAGRKFEFLAYSQSALKEHSVWFVKPFNDKIYGPTNASTIIQNIGNFSNLSYDPDLMRCSARYGARISQAFTATASVMIKIKSEDIEIKPDIKTKDGKYVFTDGSGGISEDLAKEIWRKIGPKSRSRYRFKQIKKVEGVGNVKSVGVNAEVGVGVGVGDGDDSQVKVPDDIEDEDEDEDENYPRAYQIRYQGSKGMLPIDHRLNGRKAIVLRESMIKFEAPTTAISTSNLKVKQRKRAQGKTEAGQEQEQEVEEEEEEEIEIEIEIVAAFTRPTHYHLNRQMISIMQGLGVDYEDIQKYQEQAIKSTKLATQSIQTFSNLLEIHGLGNSFRLSSTLYNLSLILPTNTTGQTSTPNQTLTPIPTPTTFPTQSSPTQTQTQTQIIKGDQFYAQLLQVSIYHILRVLKYKARIPIPNAWSLVGVSDSDGCLQEGEIYACVKLQDGSILYLDGHILISRSPMIHPGDIRIVNAIGKPGHKSHSCFVKEPLYNTVVFSTQGKRPLPSCLGGGDVDGDIYTLLPLNLHGRSFTPRHQFKPASYIPVEKKLLEEGEVCTMSDVADFVLDYILSDVVGKIATTWLTIADQSHFGIQDKTCLRLAQLHNEAVDYPKSGRPVNIRNIPKIMLPKPDWSIPETVSTSTKNTTVMTTTSVTFGDGDGDGDGEREDMGMGMGMGMGPDLVNYYRSESYIGRLYREIDLKECEPDFLFSSSEEGPSLVGGGGGDESHSRKSNKENEDEENPQHDHDLNSKSDPEMLKAIEREVSRYIPIIITTPQSNYNSQSQPREQKQEEEEEEEEEEKELIKKIFHWYSRELRNISYTCSCQTPYPAPSSSPSSPNRNSLSLSKPLSEEEIILGTIAQKTSHPKLRKGKMSSMRERTDILVRKVRESLEKIGRRGEGGTTMLGRHEGRGIGVNGEDGEEIGGEELEYDTRILKNAWISWKLSLEQSEKGVFGAKSFGWIVLGMIFDAIKELKK